MKNIFFLAVFAASGAQASEWVVSESVDKFDDSHKCTITREGSDLMVLTSKGAAIFAIQGDRYPESVMRFRVDKNPPVTATESPRTSAYKDEGRVLLSQLRTGQVILTEVTLWPDKRTATTEAEIGDLPALIDGCLAR